MIHIVSHPFPLSTGSSKTWAMGRTRFQRHRRRRC